MAVGLARLRKEFDVDVGTVAISVMASLSVQSAYYVFLKFPSEAMGLYGEYDHRRQTSKERIKRLRNISALLASAAISVADASVLVQSQPDNENLQDERAALRLKQRVLLGKLSVYAGVTGDPIYSFAATKAAEALEESRLQLASIAIVDEQTEKLLLAMESTTAAINDCRFVLVALEIEESLQHRNFTVAQEVLHRTYLLSISLLTVLATGIATWLIRKEARLMGWSRLGSELLLIAIDVLIATAVWRFARRQVLPFRDVLRGSEDA